MPAAEEGGSDAPLLSTMSNGDDENDGPGDGDRRLDSPAAPRQRQEGDAPPKITRAAKIYAFCAALNSCNLGYDIGVIAGAGPLLQSSLGLSDVQVEAFVGSLHLYAMVGALTSNWISDGLGRRWAFRVAAAVFVLGVVLQSVADEYAALMAGRCFVGLGVGFGLAVDPVYISEISVAAHRGRLVTWSEIGTNAGILLGFASGLIFAGVREDVAWRLMFALGVVMPCVVIVCATFVMPESPRWLVSKGRDDEAKGVLQMVYPHGYDVNAIVKDIKEGIEKDSIAEHAVGWNVIFFPSPAFKRMLCVGIGVAVAQQAVGIDAIGSYLVYILDESGIDDRRTQSLVGTCLVAMKLAVIFLAGYLFDRRGRRPLFLLSLLGMAVSLLLLSFAFTGNAGSEGFAVSGLALYLAFFSIGVGPAAWLIPSEVFSTLIRAKAMSVATFANRATSTIMSSSFLSVAKAMSWSWFFVMMSAVCILISAWVCMYVPETMGRPLEEMSQYFAEITGDESILEAEEILRRNSAQVPAKEESFGESSTVDSSGTGGILT